MSSEEKTDKKDQDPSVTSDKFEDSSTEPEATTVEAELKAKQEELLTLNDKYLRLGADFENFKRRSQRDQSECFQETVRARFPPKMPVVPWSPPSFFGEFSPNGLSPRLRIALLCATSGHKTEARKRVAGFSHRATSDDIEVRTAGVCIR